MVQESQTYKTKLQPCVQEAVTTTDKDNNKRRHTSLIGDGPAMGGTLGAVAGLAGKQEERVDHGDSIRGS